MSPKPNQQKQTEYPGAGKDGKHARPGGPEPHENHININGNCEDPARNEPGDPKEAKENPLGGPTAPPDRENHVFFISEEGPGPPNTV